MARPCCVSRSEYHRPYARGRALLVEHADIVNPTPNPMCLYVNPLSNPAKQRERERRSREGARERERERERKREKKE